MVSKTYPTLPAELAYAFDLSNHQGQLTPDQCQAAWDRGHRRIILNMYGLYATQQMAVASVFGFEIQAYCYLNMPGGDYWNPGAGGSAHDQVSAALDKIASTGLVCQFIWLDFEDQGNNLSIPDTIAFIWEAAHACDGRMFSGIYTAPGWWRTFTGNTTQFADAGFLLWLATDDNTPDLSGRGLPFGGWLECAMEQFDFHGDIDADLTAVEYDIDVFRVRFIPVPDAGMPPPDQGVPTIRDYTTKALSQGDSIAMTEMLFKRFGHVIADDAGETVEEVIAPQPPTGFKRIVYTYKE